VQSPDISDIQKARIAERLAETDKVAFQYSITRNSIFSCFSLVCSALLCIMIIFGLSVERCQSYSLLLLMEQCLIDGADEYLQLMDVASNTMRALCNQTQECTY
jgi:hypothetical protein